MPFVTEEIWCSFPHKENSIMISDYPVCDESQIDEKAEKEIEILMSVVKSVRNLRSEMNVSHGKKIMVYIETSDQGYSKILKEYKNIICKLASTKNVEVSESFNLSKAITAVNDYVKIYIPMDELIDREVEVVRLKKELETAKKQLEQAESRLKNKDFISKAPKKIIEGAEYMSEKLKNKIEKLNKSLSEF